MRGFPVTAAACDAPDRAAGTPRLLGAAPTQIVVCPLLIPGSAGHRVTLTPVPAPLLSALAHPDAPKPPLTFACAAYGDVPRLLFARMPDGTWEQLVIPVDACGHYLLAVLRVIDRYGP